MDSKTITRIIRGALAAGLLAFAGVEGATAGLTLGTVMAGGLGVYFLAGAISGKG